MSAILGTALLYKVNANTVGDSILIQNSKTHTIAVQADNFGGGTLTVQWSIDNINWDILVDNYNQPMVFQTNTLKYNLYFNGLYIRAVLSDSTNPQNLTATIS